MIALQKLQKMLFISSIKLLGQNCPYLNVVRHSSYKPIVFFKTMKITKRWHSLVNLYICCLYGLNGSIVYDWYRINKINIYDGLRKESAALTGCARETFLNEFKSYSTSIEITKFENSHIIEDDFKKSLWKKENLHQNKKAKAKDVKEIQTYIEKLELQKKLSCITGGSSTICWDMYPNIAQILKILLICPTSGAAVERSFSLMNMQMNKLHSLMKIWTLDALMRIFYEYEITDQDADDRVKVFFQIWKPTHWLAMMSMKICIQTFS